MGVAGTGTQGEALQLTSPDEVDASVAALLKAAWERS
jgi:hypothetical protein